MGIEKYDYLIVGAGLSGGIFAHEAIKQGKSVLVVERRNHIGGNLYCEERDGIPLHMYGPHIFHTSDKGIWEYINQFVEFNHFINSPIANYKGEIYNLPFNMNTFSKMWGVQLPDEAMKIIRCQQAEGSQNPSNLEEQAIRLVGRDIYEKLVKGYTEKQWGYTCQELPAFIIRRLPVRFTYNNNYFDDPYQGIPIEGYNVLIEKLFSQCRILLNTDFNENREQYEEMAEKIVYTGPIDAFFNYCYGHLEYRSIRFEHQRLELENYQGVAVMNFTAAEIPYTRVVEHKHFVFGKQPITHITREFPCAWELGGEPYYPINNQSNQDLYRRYFALASKQEKVLFCGRLAEYKYYDMDQCVKFVLDAVRKEFA